MTIFTRVTILVRRNMCLTVTQGALDNAFTKVTFRAGCAIRPVVIWS